MTFIDWSDPEEMFDLLMEFVRDEMNDADPEREEFLGHLLTTISAVNAVSVEDAIKKLMAIQDSIDDQFKTDPVFLHISDFINELERLK